MTEGEKKLLNTFEARVRHFIYLHEELRRENHDLKQQLEAKEQQIAKITETCKSLQKDYTNLKIAKIISTEDSDMKKTKLRLSLIVREIDKCIALLNE
jgi:cell division septum initiation protein DivIVA